MMFFEARLFAAFTIRFEAFNSLMKFFEARLLKPLQYVLKPSTH